MPVKPAEMASKSLFANSGGGSPTPILSPAMPASAPAMSIEMTTSHAVIPMRGATRAVTDSFVR